MDCGCNGSGGVSSANPQATAYAQTPVLVEYIGSCSGGMEQIGEPQELIGTATLHNYGIVQCGDLFSVWQPDLDANPEWFNEV